MEYLRKYHDPLPPIIIVEWSSPETDIKVPLPEGVHFHPQVLALRVHLPLNHLFAGY